MKSLAMRTIHQIHCPNCGNSAERHYISDAHLSRTQCGYCDYLMVSCSRTGKVIEAYAPGLRPSYLRQRIGG